MADDEFIAVPMAKAQHALGHVDPEKAIVDADRIAIDAQPVTGMRNHAYIEWRMRGDIDLWRDHFQGGRKSAAAVQRQRLLCRHGRPFGVRRKGCRRCARRRRVD